MNWEAIGAIGEVGGAIAVVATLGYLAGQIRHSSRATRLAAAHAFKHDSQEMRLALAHDAGLLDIVRRALAADASLDPIEQGRANVYIACVFDNLQFSFETRNERLIQYDLRAATLQYISQPGAREWWETGKAHLTPDFVDYVEALIPASEGMKPYWVPPGD